MARYCSASCQRVAYTGHRSHCHRLARLSLSSGDHEPDLVDHTGIELMSYVHGPDAVIRVTEALRLLDLLRHRCFSRLVAQERSIGIGHAFDICLLPERLAQWVPYAQISVCVPFDAMIMADGRPSFVEIMRKNDTSLDHDSLVRFHRTLFSDVASWDLVAFLQDIDNHGTYDGEKWIPSITGHWSTYTHCLYPALFRKSIHFVFIKFNIVGRMLKVCVGSVNTETSAELMCIIIRHIPHEFSLDFTLMEFSEP